MVVILKFILISVSLARLTIFINLLVGKQENHVTSVWVLIYPGHCCPKFELCQQLDLVKVFHLLSRRLFQF